MVILMCRRSPARRGRGANAPQVLQRTAELIPNQLRFSALSRLHLRGSACRRGSARTICSSRPAQQCVLRTPEIRSRGAETGWTQEVSASVGQDIVECCGPN